MKKTQFTLSVVAILVLSGLTGMVLSTTTQADSRLVSKSQEQTISFFIEKMTCAMCPITVKKAMTKVEGVKSVSVSFDDKIATAVFDPSVTTTQEIANASSNIGYPATPIENSLEEDR